MRELQRRQKIKQRIYSTPVLVLAALFSIILARSAFVIMQKERQSSAEVVALEAKAASLADQETQLSEDIARLKTDAGVDEEIKQKFNVSAQGEHVAVLIDQKDGTGTQATTTRPWYGRLWSAILSAL